MSDWTCWNKARESPSQQEGWRSTSIRKTIPPLFSELMRFTVSGALCSGKPKTWQELNCYSKGMWQRTTQTTKELKYMLYQKKVKVYSVWKTEGRGEGDWGIFLQIFTTFGENRLFSEMHSDNTRSRYKLQQRKFYLDMRKKNHHKGSQISEDILRY